MTIQKIELNPGAVTLKTLKRVFYHNDQIELAPGARGQVEACARQVQSIIDSGQVVYALNTGFGKFSQTRVTTEQMELLQRNLVLSHSTGIGDLLPDETVRLMLVLKVIALARGFSGVRYDVIDFLLRLINAEVYPCIPAKGSVGASGDLAPLSHMASAMIGVGQMRVKGHVVPAQEGLRAAGLEPYRLGPKEGVGLVNGTQTSTALALQGLFVAEHAMAAAICTGALSVEAAAGLHGPYDPRIHAARGQAGQQKVAAEILRLVTGSGIRHANGNSGKVQDPYSLRCQSQVLGAALDAMHYAAGVLEIESNGVSDSPLVFTEEGDVVSGGNFHAEPVAIAADVLAIATAETGAISERRLALLIDPIFSGLPAFLIKDGGINSGFMNVQVSAAALASENKSLAHPASVDSIPTSAGQEDHVSMATFAARRTVDMARNTSAIVGCELLGAAQGIDLRRPLQTTPVLEDFVSAVRQRSSFLEVDRFMAPDIEATTGMVVDGYFYDTVSGVLPSAA
ncbi:histidine ammonia-lyase [Mesorhizobium sp. CO1-1-11]|uniref:histidine ammonia-lyase n=1 Tax=Mesorhizobium sp. CO1-1-11 TaxID=2876636 RepID=UPI001CCE227E|nr:histidine ammonia-lyase [Mesorhizobium sp. CO1-1-11]MBZ9726308.1 histidine ammonia-lyase [Mesorhizobium sp. CO1-1-11]